MSAERYPIDDGSDATIAIAVTATCEATCTDADPQQIADEVGNLLHGDEVELLTVQLDAPSQLALDCGYAAQACYYPGQDRIFLSGNDAPASDGASREMVLAHEYGHHVAQHRQSPAPFPEPLDWGTARWASYENVCQMQRDDLLFPGDEVRHYYEDPGEAFAEAFARYHFPRANPDWKWVDALEPDAGAFRAIREDTLDPWTGRSSFLLSGRAPPPGRRAAVKSFRTPVDGTVSLTPAGTLRHRYELSLRNPTGDLLRTARAGLGLGQQLDFTVCGQSRLRLLLNSARGASRFRVQVQRP